MTVTSEDRTARALHALLDLAKSLSSGIDLDSLLEVIAEKASSVVDAGRTVIYVFDPDREVLWTRPPDSKTVEVPIESGAMGEVARTRTIKNIVESNAGAQSMLIAPIITTKGDLLGVLQSIDKRGADRFDASDESLMFAVASHVAVAMDRARMTAESMESARMSAGLKLASEIQMRMLPTAAVNASPDDPFDMHTYIRPATMVGGDLYDFAQKGNHLYFCIGDVSGKGVGSALVMALTKTLFRANVAYYTDPAKLTEAVNARLCEETGPTMFVTAFCGFLNLNDGVVRFCNAGHDRPFLLRRDGRVQVLDSKPGIALGVMPRFHYPLQQIRMNPGDAIFLYTDGVTEATDSSDELFAIGRLRKTLETVSRESAARVVEETMDAVDEFASRAPQADDIAMMCIRYRGRRGTPA